MSAAKHVDHGHDGGHSHGLVARSIISSREGLKAVSITLVVLLVTSALQAVVFILSGSVALLADLIHNGGDALTAIPLGIAFFLRSLSPKGAPDFSSCSRSLPARASRCGSPSSA